ncbi:retrovirus-related pol polyprotein from transposon opus [Plakobranchus ocellatus]|uniref:Retrovirus-related pol polyprotein from transposon opus n=1 Tax=Plakobranchus ocellatus TaxID=259542 RepID=A0AAV4BXW6_9GAST|nr:retrovirus-related pol polyprotein from transposon opus [Plakobranchus ocellatus]
MHTLQRAGFTLNDKSGISAYPCKIKAIVDFPQPQHVFELQRFLGIVNQTTKFSSKLAYATEPLRRIPHGSGNHLMSQLSQKCKSYHQALQSWHTTLRCRKRSLQQMPLTKVWVPSCYVEENGIRMPVSFILCTLNAAGKKLRRH